MADKWEARREALGALIREQRQQARLSLRQLAEMTSLSNPYLSQVERGLHQPSIRALKAISDALNLSAETLLAQAGLIDAIADRTVTDTATGKAGEDAAQVPQTERVISADPRLSEDQKAALLTVYRSMVSPGASPAPPSPGPRRRGRPRPGPPRPGNI
jgi:transcriptional regulator with XRE-family HTH domain